MIRDQLGTWVVFLRRMKMGIGIGIGIWYLERSIVGIFQVA